MRLRSLALTLAASSLVSLSGCGLGSIDAIAPTPVAAAVAQPGGRVHGGNQPVVGSTVQLWQAGTSGFGSAPSALGAPVTSGAGGAFTLGSYTCPSASTPVYLTATGGNPGLAAGTNNTALVMLAALGQCGTLTASTFTNINEVSTVAAVYALQQYMSASGNIGSNTGNVGNFLLTFDTLNNLVNSSTGTALSVTPYGNGIVPQAEIDTLANILTPCVNSTGPTSASCAALFAAATPSGGAQPSNTLTAALAIAQNPGQNQATLFNLSAANPAFLPALSSAPNDWSLALSYSTGATQAFAIALDQFARVWVANGNVNSLSAMSLRGVPFTNSPFTNTAYLNNPEGLAIDSANNVWVANYGGNSVTEFAISSGAISTVSGPYTTLGLSGPNSVAVDSSNNIWIGSFNGNFVTELLNGGGSSNTFPNIPKPNSLAIDSFGDVWAADFGSAEISEIASGGNGQFNYSGGGLSSPTAIAIGSSNTLWAPDASLAQLADIASNGGILSPSQGFSGGGLTSGYGVAVDGLGNVWIPDNVGNRISEFSPAGVALSPSTGFQGGSLSTPRELAIDATGNVWVANRYPVQVNSAYQTVTEFIGLAAPTYTPIVAGVKFNSIARRPGTLAIVATGLSNATVATPYSFGFAGTGGNGSYTWSITSGLTALQTAGFSFSTAGVLSGTPTAVANYSFAVQLTDTGTGQTVSAPYTLTVVNPAATSCTHDGSGNAVLNGNYAFLMSGFNPAGHFYDSIGSFKANGAGAISSGSADVNGDQNIALFASGEQQYSFAGTYSIGSSDNRGTMTVANTNTAATGLPATTTYCFAADTITGGVAYSGHIIQADQSGFVQTGFFTIQNSTTFANSAITGGYAFGMQGVATTATNRRAWIGQFTASGNGAISSGQYDVSGANGSAGSIINIYNPAKAISSGTYTVGANGRGTLTLNVGGTLLPFVVYTVGTGQQFYMLSANASAGGTTPLLVGHAVQQTTTNFTAANVKSNGIFRFAGTTNPNSPPLADDVAVGQLVLDGTGIYSFFSDENSGGSITTPAANNGSGTYTVSPIGYVSLSNGPNFYLWAPGAGFGADNSTSVDAFFMLPQTVPSGGFSSANLSTYVNGNYAAGSLFPATYSAANNYPFVFSLFANFNSGIVSNIQDAVGAPATAGYILLDNPNVNNYALDPTYGPATGRILITSGGTSVVGYIISPTQAFLIQNQPNNVGTTIQGDHW